VAKKRVAKSKGQSKEGQFVELPSNVGQKIKSPNNEAEYEALLHGMM
jgi:hypothetical protein